MSTNISKKTQSRTVRYQGFQGQEVQRQTRDLAEETALDIMINGRSYGLLMETPGHERELVTGYLYTEGLIDGPEEISGLTVEPGDGFMGMDGIRAMAVLPNLDETQALPERMALSLSSCGLCGKESLDQVGRGVVRVRSRQHFSWQTLYSLLADLRKRQPLYEKTHGVHAASVYTADGEFLCCFEDVGRHNAMDKAIGHCLINGISLTDKVVVLSGRASLEMIIKAVRAGLPLFLCFSNPTILAVETAKSLNLTLVAREDDYTLAAYTHTRRIEE